MMARLLTADDVPELLSVPVSWMRMGCGSDESAGAATSGSDYSSSALFGLQPNAAPPSGPAFLTT